jgi:hypothetical protein
MKPRDLPPPRQHALGGLVAVLEHDRDPERQELARRRIREAGRSLAIVEGVRNPLRSYFADLIETKVLRGPNPAADLKHFVGKDAHRKAKARRRVNAGVYFTQEEGPQLMATAKALCPRWAPSS